MRDIVVLGKLLSIEGLARGWGTRDENLDGVQATEIVELFVELHNVADDTLL